MRAGTQLGLEAKAYMDRGDLVPDSVILGIVGRGARAAAVRATARFSTASCAPCRRPKDSTPCSSRLGRKVDAVLAFDIDNDEIVQRLSGRTVCQNCQTPYTGREVGSACAKCGGTLVRRKDDDPEAVRTRLRVYDEQTAPVLRLVHAARREPSPSSTPSARLTT